MKVNHDLMIISMVIILFGIAILFFFDTSLGIIITMTGTGMYVKAHNSKSHEN